MSECAISRKLVIFMKTEPDTPSSSSSSSSSSSPHKSQTSVPSSKPSPPVPMSFQLVKSKVDLRMCQTQSQTTGKQMILTVMDQLIDHTQLIIKASNGRDRIKHQFRLSQFKKAIGTLRSYSGEITSGHQAMELHGIGKGIAKRIDEIIQTQTLTELSQITKIDEKTRIMNELTSVTGIGESYATKYIEMGVTCLEDFCQKVKSGQIRVTHHIQVGLRYYDDFQQKIPFSEIDEIGQLMKQQIQQLYPQIMIEICGSHRRQLPMSGDIDVLMMNPQLMTDDDLIQSPVRYLKEIVKMLKDIGLIIDDLTSNGDTKYMGVCLHPKSHIGRRLDIRFVTYESYYSSLLYLTGSMQLNKLMRLHAIQKGYTLNEYGLCRVGTDKKIIVHSEKDIFDELDVTYLEPVERSLI